MSPAELYWRVWERLFDCNIESADPLDVVAVQEAALYATEDAALVISQFQVANNGGSKELIRRLMAQQGTVRGVEIGERERGRADDPPDERNGQAT